MVVGERALGRGVIDHGAGQLTAQPAGRVNPSLGKGAISRPVKVPNLKPLFATAQGVSAAEIAAAHAKTFPSQAIRYGENLRNMLEKAHKLDPVALGKSNIVRAQFRGAVTSLFEEVDVIIAPVFRKGTPTWAEARD